MSLKISYKFIICIHILYDIILYDILYDRIYIYNFNELIEIKLKYIM